MWLAFTLELPIGYQLVFVRALVEAGLRVQLHVVRTDVVHSGYWVAWTRGGALVYSECSQRVSWFEVHRTSTATEAVEVGVARHVEALALHGATLLVKRRVVGADARFVVRLTAR